MPAEATMTIELPDLPYPRDALAPHISAETLDVHHGKHHKAYVEKTNALIAGTALAEAPLDEIVRQSMRGPAKGALFNNAAQAWNHAFYWRSMRPRGGGRPDGALARKLETSFKGFDGFAEAFKTAAVNQFGSGWAWLVLEGGSLQVVATSNADTPLANGQAPLLTIDVWEHAYYLDYKNARADYVAGFLENLVNWEFAAGNLALAESTRTAAA
jgi:Fe-Mn family superoxide dismutase